MQARGAKANILFLRYPNLCRKNKLIKFYKKILMSKNDENDHFIEL